MSEDDRFYEIVTKHWIRFVIVTMSFVVFLLYPILVISALGLDLGNVETMIFFPLYLMYGLFVAIWYVWIIVKKPEEILNNKLIAVCLVAILSFIIEGLILILLRW